MKDQLNEHTPKPESWDNILERISFENQLQDHLPNLPEFSPDEEAWSEIEGRLEEKKPILYWQSLKIAAGIIGILLASGWVIYNWKSVNETNPKGHPLITAVKKEIPLILKKPTVQVSEITKVPKLKPVVSQMKDELQLANLKVPEIEFTAFKLEILLPEPTLNHEEKPEPIPKKTLHEVTISWGIESSKPKIGTSFGRQDRYLNQTFQTDKKSIRIRFGQDN